MYIYVILLFILMKSFLKQFSVHQLYIFFILCRTLKVTYLRILLFKNFLISNFIVLKWSRIIKRVVYDYAEQHISRLMLM